MPTLPLKKSTVRVLDLRKRIIQWNNLYPWDYQWRQKHKVAFGSPLHREMTLWDMRFELRESQIYTDLLHTALNERKLAKRKVKPLERGELFHEDPNFLKTVSDEEFDDLDLSQFNDLVL